MSHHVPGPPDYDVVMTEQVPGLNGPKMLGRHKPTAPIAITIFFHIVLKFTYQDGTEIYCPGINNLMDTG